MQKKYTSLSEFYPYYLTEHQDKVCQTLHFVGTIGVLYFLLQVFLTGNAMNILYGLLCGYGFAWLGHFFFEKNKPATFQYSFYSLASDFIMYFHIVTFQLPKKMQEAKQIMGK
ncbi:MAG: Mpo1-like protein [Bacteroidia bacterium]